MFTKPQAILDFWFKETPFEKKFKKDISFDGVIREKFLKDYELAAKNEYDDWQDNVKGSLALIILLDQFSRNLFRDNKKAFEQDKKARLILNEAISRNFLEEMNNDERLFMLLPLIHSEEIFDHENAYRLLDRYLNNHPNIDMIKKFWNDHTKAIKKFHRYPHRNKILERESTEEEEKFLEQPNSNW